MNNDKNYEPNNCRFVTSQTNNCNTRLLRIDNTSGYRGVTYHKKSNKWIAQISIKNNRKCIGSFNSSKEAAQAYNDAITDERPKNPV